MYEELVIEVHSGEGGQDSKLFIRDLAGAYTKFASQ